MQQSGLLPPHSETQPGLFVERAFDGAAARAGLAREGIKTRFGTGLREDPLSDSARAGMGRQREGEGQWFGLTNLIQDD